MKQVLFVLLSVDACLLLLKTILFKQHFSKKPLQCWFYFNVQEMMLTTSNARRREKRKQNTLSIVSLLTVLLSMVWYFLFNGK